MAFPTLNHIAVTVRDIEISGPWYRRLLGAEPVVDEHTDAGFHHQVWVLDGGTLLGIHQHDRRAPDEKSASSGSASTTSAWAAPTVPSWRTGSAGWTGWASPMAVSWTRLTAQD